MEKLPFISLRKLAELGIVAIAIATLVLAGCGGGGSSSAASTSTQITAFKGMFTSGTATIFDAHGAYVTTATIQSGVGTATYPSNTAFPLVISVAGSYLNEVTGQIQAATTPLHGFITAASSVSAVPVTAITELGFRQLQSAVGASLTAAHAASAIDDTLAVSYVAAVAQQLQIPDAVPQFNADGQATNAVAVQLAGLAYALNTQYNDPDLSNALQRLANDNNSHPQSGIAVILPPAALNTGIGTAAASNVAPGANIGTPSVPPAPPAYTPPPPLYSASGTYSWDSGTDTLTVDFTASTFNCNGPTVGAQTMTGVSVGAGTMTGVGKNTDTWTRLSGAATAGNILGSWTTTEGGGNTLTLTLNADDTITATGVIGTCSAQNGSPIQMQMRIDQGPNGTIGPRQYVNIDVSTPVSSAISSVSVSGPGAASGVPLIHGPLTQQPGSSTLYDRFFGGFSPSGVVNSGATYTITEVSASGVSSSFTASVGTAVTNTVSGAITITSPASYGLGAANLGHPLTVTWTLPSAYTVVQVNLGGYGQTSTDPTQGYQCLVNSNETLTAGSTSGTVTFPLTCGPNNDPVVAASINVSSIGTNGESSIDLYQF